MRRLYWKIFFAFWLVMILVIVTNLAVTWIQVRLFQSSEQKSEHISELAQEAAEIYEERGRQALILWKKQLFHRTDLKVLLLDEHNRQVSGHPLPPHFKDLLEGRSRRGNDNRQRSPYFYEPEDQQYQIKRRQFFDKRFRPIIWPTISASGKRYHFVVLNPHELSDHLYSSTTLLWRIGISILIVILVALLLSHYLVKPIRLLQHASRKLADGDLNSRVAKSMGKRRDELGQLGLDFDTMAHQIQALLEGQQQMLRDISHELRTPLARLRIALELARKRSGESNELDRMELEAERINELIDEILCLVRLNSNQNDYHSSELELVALLRPLVEDANFEQQRVLLKAPETTIIHGDDKLLYRAIENIVRNALKYSEGEVEVKLEPCPDSVEISITDSGPGVDKDSLERLFEPFFRADQSRGRESGGYGLGLAIAAKAIKLHQGKITARNRESGGLEVCISLPCGQSPKNLKTEHHNDSSEP
ncbi:HAMP domain-containing histidine kinase [Motiliproteus sp. MSK22-1]|uniref:HAMP domain-containing histidine kinase n=1 Tax=Motiliproteus sp. MSK22-1 TaxID=1897630 RepID=UPI000975E856|nr:HAMP domain-containing histidine kinase [Motiliproteus sp. MSK22-1]OMH38951.1 hypothetical protein BGP75_04290 [Motiliproteus sp. MSK22-1]